MTKFKTVQAWAQAVGSKAKTRAGQRKAILNSFRSHSAIRDIPRLAALDSTVRHRYVNYANAKKREDYYAQRQRARQEAFAHNLCKDIPLPATLEQVYGDRAYRPVPLSDLVPNSRNISRVGDWIIRCEESISWDNDRYSKSYHAKYGGVKVVDSRKVLIRRVREDGTLEKRDQGVDAWRGNFVLNALISTGIVETHKGQMHVRLHAAYDVRLVRKARSLSIYERTLADDHVDYCAVWHGLTFHADTQALAVAGLRKKLHNVTAQKNAPIDFTFAKQLGFCESGIKQFAADFNLDLKSRYTAAQIADRVMGDLSTASKYRSELHKLAESVNYPVPAGL